MDWANEPYVRVYTRETDDDLALSYDALALWGAMLKKFDRAGLIETKRGISGLAAITRCPIERVPESLAELVKDGRVVPVSNGYFAPNFLAAQETPRTDKARQRDSRSKRAAKAHAEHRETTSMSHGVTLTSADPDLDSALLASALEHARESGDRDLQSANEPAPTKPPGERERSAEPAGDPERPGDHKRQLELVRDEGEPINIEPIKTPGPTTGRTDVEIRRTLWNEAWTFAGLTFVELRSFDTNAHNCWHLPAHNSFESVELTKRVDELLRAGDVKHARSVLRNRVLVAAAKVRHQHKHLRFFTPPRMWDAKWFAEDASLTPGQIEAAAIARGGGPKPVDKDESSRIVMPAWGDHTA